MISRIKITHILTYLGLIPFVGFFTLGFMKPDYTFHGINAVQALLFYAGVIAAFVSGTHWGLLRGHDNTGFMMVLSNICALIIVVALLIGVGHLGFGLLAVVFILQLWMDNILCQQGFTDREYLEIRTIASVIVTVVAMIAGMIF